MRPFVGREPELTALRAALARPSSLSLLFGQRRVGKTYLLQHLLRGVPRAVTFMADESTSASLLRRFRQELAASGLHDPLWDEAAPSDWGVTLTSLCRWAVPRGGLVLALDEFQYLMAAEPALPSILQRLWDTFEGSGGLHVILCGSALGTLGRLGEQGQPLHGRFGLRARLRPFTWRDAIRFVPGWSFEAALRAFGVFGSLARHLAEVDPREDLATNARRAVLDPLAPLHEAPLDILRTEHLSSHADANAVLAAVAAGENRFSAIASRTGLASERAARVIDELIALDVVERVRRFGDRPGSRFTRYRCTDPFVTFWFRFVQPNRTAIGSAGPERVWDERVAGGLDDHMGAVFEDAVRQAALGGWVAALPTPVDEAAPWWSRDGRTEIDLLLRAGDEVVAVEAKWRPRGEIGVRDLAALREHAARCPAVPSQARLALATAGRASPRLRAVAEAEGILLLEPDALLGA